MGIGSTGKVRVLMLQDLDLTECSLQKSTSCKRMASPVLVSLNCGASRKSLQLERISSNNVTTSGSSNSNREKRRNSQKKTHQTLHPHTIPMLESEDISIDRTPATSETESRRSRIVEVVDLKCGNSRKSWSPPITNDLRRLSFLKLTD